MSAIFPVILSGGSGTRLWPLSRAMYPKQFIRFFNGQSSSFLGATLTRLKTRRRVSRRRSCCATTITASSCRRRSTAPASSRRRSSWSRSRAIRRRRSRSRRSPRCAKTPAPFSPSCRPTTSSRTRRASSRASAAPPKSRQRARLVLFGIKPTEAAHRLRLHPPGRGARRLQRRRLQGRGLLREARHGHGRSAISPTAATSGTAASSC